MMSKSSMTKMHLIDQDNFPKYNPLGSFTTKRRTLYVTAAVLQYAKLRHFCNPP